MAQRIRIGIDTGGTFTDVVALDEESGELVTTKTPSTPANPADGFLAGVQKVLAALGADGDAIGAVSHGTTVATNQLLEGKVDRLGFITTAGYEAMLEIARQSGASGGVPDCINNGTYVDLVGGLAGATGIQSTPTVRINGEDYQYSTPEALVTKIKEIVGDVPGLEAAPPAPAPQPAPAS